MAKHLQRAIDKLMEQLISLSAKVEENVHQSILSLEEMNRKMAERVIRIDEEIDQREIEIEEECLKIFALHQPVAIDLRYLVAILKINNDLERIGDLSQNIAKHAIHVMKAEKTIKRFKYSPIAQKVQIMLKKSLDALINLSSEIAKEVLQADDEVDRMNKELSEEVIKEIKNNPDQVDLLIHFIHISRHLERIADHTTNIAEDLIYLTQGDIIRHSRGPA